MSVLPIKCKKTQFQTHYILWGLLSYCAWFQASTIMQIRPVLLKSADLLGVVLWNMVDDTEPPGITFIKTIIFIIICREASYLTGIKSGHSLPDENICRYEDKNIRLLPGIQSSFPDLILYSAHGFILNNAENSSHNSTLPSHLAASQ